MFSTQETNLTTAEAYYRCMREKDISGVARFLHADIRLLSPLAEVAGKDAALEAANRFASLLKRREIRTKFSSDDALILAYDADFGEPIDFAAALHCSIFKMA